MNSEIKIIRITSTFRPVCQAGRLTGFHLEKPLIPGFHKAKAMVIVIAKVMLLQWVPLCFTLYSHVYRLGLFPPSESDSASDVTIAIAITFALWK